MDNALQEHEFALLKEFHDICESNSITYVLANHSAWDAQKFGVYHGNFYQSTVMLTEEELEKLSSVDLPESRAFIDYTLQGCERLYADTNSVFVHYEAYIDPEWPVPGVEIVVAHQNPEKETECIVKNPDLETFTLPVKMFDNLTLKKIEDSYFYVFADMNAYLSKLASPKWKEKNWPYKAWTNNVNAVFFKGMSPKTFLEMPLVQQSMEEDGRAMRSEYWEWLNAEYKPARKVILHYQDYLARTEDRFNLWEKYYPIKREILQLASINPTDERLEEVLDDFLETFWKWERKRLPISFDEQILQASIPLLVKRHGSKKTQIAIDRIPIEYRDNDVSKVLIEHGIHHPLLSRQEFDHR